MVVYIGNYLDNFKKLIGQRIRKKREELGLNQEDLGVKIGATQSRVSRWEKGANRPGPRHREQLCSIFKVDESFFDPTNNPPPKPTTTVIEISEIAAFLARLAKISHDQRNLIFALVFEDESYLDGRPQMARAFSTLVKGFYKEV